MEFRHIPVLLDKVIEGLDIKNNGIYVDCTMGGGGHSSVIATNLSIEGKLIGFDRDIEAVNVCRKKFATNKNVEVIHANFKDFPSILQERGLKEKIDGILVDLGVSSYQIDNGERGFSFLREGRLDMRMDTSQEKDAYFIVNNYPKEKLIKILYQYGEESNAKRIVENICENRKVKPIETNSQNKNII